MGNNDGAEDGVSVGCKDGVVVGKAVGMEDGCNKGFSGGTMMTPICNRRSFCSCCCCFCRGSDD